MKLPSKVKIGPYDYALIVKDNLRKPGGDEVAWGHFDFKNACIEIEADVPNNQARQMIVIHEIIHSMLDVMELNWSDGSEEDFVKRFTPVLLAFIKENPKVVEYLRQ